MHRAPPLDGHPAEFVEVEDEIGTHLTWDSDPATLPELYEICRAAQSRDSTNFVFTPDDNGLLRECGVFHENTADETPDVTITSLTFFGE